MNTNTCKVYEALLKNVEGVDEVNIDGKWTEMGIVYIDNAFADSPEFSRPEFAGYLSALEATGHYVKGEEAFGFVKQ